MENNKIERIIFRLIRVFGILSILGVYLDNGGLFECNILKLGDVSLVLVSPFVVSALVTSIIVYLIIIRLIEKHFSITLKASK